ncbi:MAG TPA: sigma factor-like helix-turn-helix DNA-binding protein, partial [Acidimicrobiia bacterium]|nr:sigma factor-like helix-turn-helix DNA-binding protein [Acidimicrobiia bacterium]
EIAATLDRPVGTVRSDVHRGRQRLRRSLEEES